MIAYKFLAAGALAPFTEFRWPTAGEWVSAPSSSVDVWIHACRPRDLPYWLDEELWRIELQEPVREARFQIASARGRLLGRVGAWSLRELAEACAIRARDLALPHLAPPLRDALAAASGLDAIVEVARKAGGEQRAAAYVADAAQYVDIAPATTPFIAATLAAWLGGDAAAFDTERAWQAQWLAARLGLGAEGSRARP